MASATVSTIYKNTFKNLYSIIDNNKVSGSKVLGGFPNLSKDLPSYTLHPIQPSSTQESVNNVNSYDMMMEIELWCKGSDLKVKIDEMKQSIMNAIDNNIATLYTNNIIKAKDWFDDTNVNTVEINNKKYHTGKIMLRFLLA